MVGVLGLVVDVALSEELWRFFGVGGGEVLGGVSTSFGWIGIGISFRIQECQAQIFSFEPDPGKREESKLKYELRY